MAGNKKVALPVIEDESILRADVQDCTKTLLCSGCELEKKPRVPGAGASGIVDIMLVSESPSSWSSNNQALFNGRGGRIIKSTWKQLVDDDDKAGRPLKLRTMRKWDTYAVQCQVEEGREAVTASKSTVDRCSKYLHSAIKDKKPKIVLAFGSLALKSLGYKGDKFMEARGRLLDMEIGGHRFKVLATFSTKHLMAKTGLYTLFLNDFRLATRFASGVDNAASQMTIEEITKDYKIPTTVAEVGAVCDEIINHVVDGAKSASQCAVAVDTETNTLNPHRADAKVLCVSFAWDTGRATAIPLWHREATWTPEELEQVKAHVQRVLSCAKPKVFHNLKFDAKFLELRHGFKVINVAWDTLLGEHLLREDQSGSYSLKILGRSYFPQFAGYADKVHEMASALTVEEEQVHSAVKNVKKGLIKAKGTGKNKEPLRGFDEGMFLDMGKAEVEKYLFGSKKGRKMQTFDSGYERVELSTLLLYAAIDTDLTRRLLRNQFLRMKEEGFMSAKDLMHSHAIPASRVLGKMEFGGMRVDRPYVDFLETELGNIVLQQGAALRRHWDKPEEFNPNSTAHVGEILYNKGAIGEDGKRHSRLGPWCEKNLKSGNWKTDKKTLRAIYENTKCTFTKALLDYRAAHKGLSGFIHDIKLLSEYDGFLHTSFHLHGTSTGRLSSSHLNMQNLPLKLAKLNIKKIFIPDDPDEELIFNVDWKGAEIRVFTAYAFDKELIDALNNGLDVHSFFTQEIFGIPYEEVEAKKETDMRIKDLRTTVKRVVFGVLYGAMAKKIAETAGISEERAQEVIDKLFLRFPSLKNYMDETVAQIHQLGFVETLFHRRRRFPLSKVNGFFRGQAERRGKNMKIQSTSSDIVVSQLIEIDEHIAELGGRLAITVHDSIVGTVKKKYADQLPAFFDKYCVKRVAEKYPWLPVAFAADVTVGPNYGEQMDILKYLKQEAERKLTEEEAMLLEIDSEIDNELREDEDEAREREQTEALLAGDTKAAS